MNYRSRDFEDSTINAIKYAFRLLGYRDRSEKEMYERLIQKGFSEKITLEAIDYLSDKGFIDDRRFAEVLRKDAVERKYFGRSGARNYLLNKGIAARIVEDILGDEGDYIDAAKRLVEKKIRNMKNIDAETVRRRLWGMLARRGFSYDTINKVLKSYDSKEE
ncbi:regulatory protein RecX [hot springs metagenome]|uniref:Regulatory protein RecX n=1 Tax=hot springs metagenome TaxID=433727 RepID=A0A5J4L678_9ZZZZ